MIYHSEKQGAKMMGNNADIQETVHKIRNWAIARGLDDANPRDQMLKLHEEAGEATTELTRGDIEALKCELGDIQVTLTVLATQIGSSIEECAAIAYNKIKNRTGKTINGIFVKDEDL